MACRKSRGSRILLCLGLLVFASSFCLCTKLTRLKALDKLRKNSTLSKGQAKTRDTQRGRLLIGQNSLPDDKLNGTKATKNFLDVDTDYQEDMGWEDPKQLQRQSDGFSKPDNAAMEQLLLMDPKVECTGDSMKLQVQNAASTPGALFVDRGSHLSPLALSKLPPSCGYTIRSTQRELVLVAPYDGCFVALEEDSYVLPMRWLGLNVRMSCPLMKLSSPNPPMVTCHPEGMVVKTGWTVSITKMNVKLNGNWEPLMKASPRCGFSVVVHPEGVVLSVRYTPCMEKKDGMYTLELAGEGEAKMSCPSLPWPQASADPQQQPFYPQPETENPTAAPSPQQTKVPPGQVQPPVYPQPETENPTVAPRPQQTKAPQGQAQPPFYPHPFYPQPETEKPSAALRPSQTKAPWGQVQPPFYPYPFYPQPETKNPTTAPSPQQSKAPQGQVQQFYPYPFYPQPETENPTAAPRPPQIKAPLGQVQPPFYPYPFYPQPETENPTAAPRPPQIKAPLGQVQPPFYPYPFYPQPETEKPVTSPSATTMEQLRPVITHNDEPPLESAIPQPSNSDVVPQGPQLGSPYVLPVYCPQFCPSGISNCCPQIAFHQHHHYIIPSGLGRDAPSLYPGLPYLPLAYSGFGSLNSDLLPQNPTKIRTQVTTTSISAPVSSQSQYLPSGNQKFPRPPDGNPAVLNHPSKPSSFDQPIYPFVPNSLYPHWPYVRQNEALQRIPQSQSPAHYNVFSKPQASGSEPVNPLLQYNEQSPQQQNGQLLARDINLSGPNFMSYSGQYLHSHTWQSSRIHLQPRNNNI
ncbi:bromodomain-containing protein 4-like [Etheostoma spectabile]|uniref:bromodomain-containing protein 4-like n=1 Tax=Etheostoma spectabile TaxID=54343 RepID=UPI0013AECC90|nr:bromodomain-containing protein 4-like [Etheostoma spectabile]